MATVVRTTIQPLVELDVEVYDVVPNGRLFLDDFIHSRTQELDTEKLDNFIDRYIHTNDRDVRKTFLEAMEENNLWEEIGKRIRKKASGDIEDPELRARLEYILEHEFPVKSNTGSSGGRVINGSTEAQYEYIDQSVDTDGYSLKNTTHSTSAKGAFRLRQPLGIDRLLSVTGSLLGRVNNQDQKEVMGDMAVPNDALYYGSQAEGFASLQRRDDFFKLGLGAYHEKYFSPPNDHLSQALFVLGSAELHDLMLRGNPLSATARIKYIDIDNTAPPEASGLLTRGNNTLESGIEATYRFSRFGLVVDGDFSRSDLSEYYSTSENSSWATGAMLQYTSGQNYIRMGPGYGQWSGEYLGYGEAQPIDNHGRDIHGKVKGQFALDKRFRLQGAGKMQALESTGTFVGWYPAWETSMGLVFATSHWTTSLEATYNGNRIDLNEYQESHAVDGRLRVAFNPKDWLKIEVAPSLKHNKTIGYQAYTTREWGIDSLLKYNFTPWNRLWLTGFAGVRQTTYDDYQDNHVAGNGWRAGGGAEIVY